jgi:hypothetical protein
MFTGNKAEDGMFINQIVGCDLSVVFQIFSGGGIGNSKGPGHITTSYHTCIKCHDFNILKPLQGAPFNVIE